MKEVKLKDSPIVYYISKVKQSTKWLLFLHAAFVHHQMFKEQIEYFKDKYNILVVDIIGHGKSIQGGKGDSIDKMSGWLKEIMEDEYIKEVHIVGISLGAVLAQDFANHYPEMVKSLSCFGGYDINNFDATLQKENSISQMFMILKGLFSVKWFAKANKKISAYMPEAQEEFYKMNIQFHKKSFMYLSTLSSMVNVKEPQTRNYPLLIGCGEHDVAMALTAIKMWQDSEPDCKVVIFEDAGHCVNMDIPQMFNKVLEKFWDII